MTRRDSFHGGALYEKSWDGDYFGRRGAIALAKKKYRETEKRGGDLVGALSGLSSTYYSAAGHAYARFQMTYWPLWALRAWYCLRQAVKYSGAAIHRAHGIRGLSADQLDVRQSILRKAAEHEGQSARFGTIRAALDCIEAALHREHLAMHTRGLLLVGKIDLLTKYPGMHDLYPGMPRRGDIKTLLQEAMGIAEGVARDNPRQAARIFRGCAVGFERSESGVQAVYAAQRARELAKSVEAHDQLLKMGGR